MRAIVPTWIAAGVLASCAPVALDAPGPGGQHPLAEQQQQAAATLSSTVWVPAGHIDPQTENHDGFVFDELEAEMYNGVWGVASGGREYALQSFSRSLFIIDVTDPRRPTELCRVDRHPDAPDGAGRVHGDVDVHFHEGVAYAYWGGQERADLYVLPLDGLPARCPEPLLLGYRGDAHTLFIHDGVLYLSGAFGFIGCTALDLTPDPLAPRYIGNLSPHYCHDGYARGNKLVFADTDKERWDIFDITDIRVPRAKLLGSTPPIPGSPAIYGHSAHLDTSGDYLFAFEESDTLRPLVFDVSNPRDPRYVTSFRTEAQQVGAGDGTPHNGEVRDDMLWMAWYALGLVGFDISDPTAPVQTYHFDTWRDPDADGIFDDYATTGFRGAWNLHVDLPSGTILVSDTRSGLFVFESPVPRETFCGDGTCQPFNDEDCSHCPVDCGECVGP